MTEAGGWTNDFLGIANVLEDGGPILAAGANVADELAEMTGVKR